MNFSAPQRSNAIAVSELNRQVKSLLESSFLSIRVVGEISNLARPSSGHWYFTLKDQNAQVRCAMFRGNNQRVGFSPKEGDQVVITAKVSLFEGRGDYQLICSAMEQDGAGQLQLLFEQLKAKLQAEGLFAPERKQPIPKHPKAISGIEHGVDACLAVVTHDQANELLAAFVKSTAAVIPDLHIVVVVLQVARIGVSAQIAPFSNGGIAQEAIVAFVRIRLENNIGYFTTGHAIRA